MTRPGAPRLRIRVAADLMITLDRHLLTIATSRWEPGVLVYDVEFLAVKVEERRQDYSVTMSARGENYDFQVLRFRLPPEQHEAFARVIVAAAASRDALRARETGTP